MEVKGAKIVMIGGGTGSFTLLSALKNYVNNITAIVNMADDGGSTGVLRDELGALPPGDIRQCLVALSEESDVMRQLFNYRFGEGSLAGHSFGNLFLTALEKTTGSFAEAVKTAGAVLNVTGRVVPVTLDDSKLVVHENGETTKGEFKIANMRFKSGKLPQLYLEPEARLNPEARAAIMRADLVVIAPGNLYGSLIPALLPTGMSEALQQTDARLVYVCNLVTKPGQTDGYKVHDYAAEIERFVGAGELDYVLYNTHKPPREALDKYAKEGEYWVEYSQKGFKNKRYEAIGDSFISDIFHTQDPNDTLIERTLIRHDADKVARTLMRLYFS